MRALMRTGLMLAVALPLAVGQLAAQKPDKPKRANRDLVTREQIDQNPAFKSAYDVVEALHSAWLVPRSASLGASAATASLPADTSAPGGITRMAPPAMGVPGEAAGVRVYVDRVYVGHIDELKTIPVMRIQWIRHYVGNEAQQEFGMGNSAGVILVSTVQ